MRRLRNDNIIMVMISLTVLFMSCGGGSGQQQSDNTPPFVSSVTPVNNAVDVPIKKSITINFSEQTKTSTITSSTIAVSQNGLPVNGVLSVNGNTVVYKPNSNFSNSTTYSIKVSGNIEDLSGNKIGHDNTFTFSTYALFRGKNVGAGPYCSYLVQLDNSLWSWGANNSEQLGNGSKENNPLPGHVLNNDGTPFNGIAMASGGVGFSVALKNDGTVWTWGSNGDGQLGNPTFYQSSRSYPDIVTTGSGGVLNNILSVKAGINDHILALKSDGTAWVWGSNSSGKHGNGTYSSQFGIPDKVINIDNIIKIAAGRDHNVVLRNDGTVWAWGDTNDGQVGNGAIAGNYPYPVQVKDINLIPLLNVKEVAAGNTHTIALKNDGSVWEWGGTSRGFGNGTPSCNPYPVLVNGVFNATKVVISTNDTIYALLADGTVIKWSGDCYTQVSPTIISGLSNIIDIAAGYSHVLAISSNNTLFALGGNNYGQIGDGTYVDVPSPILIE